MERFPPYKGEIYVAKKMVAAEPGLKKIRTNEDIMELSLTAAKEMCARQSTHPSIVGLILEMVHYTASHKVISLTKDLAESLAETAMNEICLENLRLPFHLFELCIERGTRIPDIDGDVPGMLVLAGADDATTDVVMKSLDHAGLVLEGGRQHVKNAFRMMWARKDVKHQSNIDLGTVRNKTIDDIINELPTFEACIPLNDVEKKETASMMRLIMGVLCYLNVKEPDLQNYKDRQRIQLGEKPDNLLLGACFKKSPSWHLRRAHFRVLRDERYHRDDEGRPRVVWVREAEVNPECAKMTMSNDGGVTNRANRRT